LGKSILAKYQSRICGSTDSILCQCEQVRNHNTNEKS
jgi:hypothetical protein